MFCFVISQEEFTYENTFYKIIEILCTYLRNDYSKALYGRIGSLFGKIRSTVYDQYENYLRG